MNKCGSTQMFHQVSYPVHSQLSLVLMRTSQLGIRIFLPDMMGIFIIAVNNSFKLLWFYKPAD